MTGSTNSQVRAKEWLKPDQVDTPRTTYYEVGADYLQQRNNAIVATLADTFIKRQRDARRRAADRHQLIHRHDYGHTVGWAL